MGLSWAVMGSSQATLRPRVVGSDTSVEAKMTGITPVAFTCSSSVPVMQEAAGAATVPCMGGPEAVCDAAFGAAACKSGRHTLNGR